MRSDHVFAVVLLLASLALAFSPRPSAAEGFTPEIYRRIYPPLAADEIKKNVKRLQRLLPRIIGGTDAKPGEFPHQVSLMISSRYGGDGIDRHFCGGSIVADEWVMTAAHCASWIIGSQSDFSIGSGGIDLNKLEEYELDGVWVHPAYDGATLDYDFALIKVRRPFFDREIAVVNRAENQLIDVGTAATITGWGVDASGNIQKILKKADVNVVSRADCNDANSYNGAVTSRMICLGLPQGGKDTCQGDSGGPAIARVRGGEPVLFATTSWGEGCAQPQKYGVYGRLIAVRSWIDTVTGGVVLRQHSATAQ